jgi:ribosomal protein S18 acetylase RimI-like enzyme
VSASIDPGAPAFPLRLATPADLPALEHLITRSVEQLSVGHYSPAEIQSTLRYVFGPDSQLIADRTYFVVTDETRIVGAGGWSRRATLYGGNQMKQAEDPLLDPARDPARIRACFVDPDYARRGIGRQLLAASAMAAEEAGFRELVLVATLPGVPFYTAAGFRREEERVTLLPDGVAVRFVRMTRPTTKLLHPQ